MENGNGRANVFVFTSYQGGIGKSSIAWRFAEAFRKLKGTSGAVLEINRFTPSYHVETLNKRDQLKGSFFDFLMSNWSKFTAEMLPEMFSEHDGLYLIPFTGVRSKESLRPRFNFHDGDAEAPLERLINALRKQDIFIVVDLPFSLAPMSQVLLDHADAVFYVYTNQAPSPAFAQQFAWECEHLPGVREKVTFVRNHCDPGAEKGELCLFDNEIILPMGDKPANEGHDAGSLAKPFSELARRAFDMPRRFPMPKPSQELEGVITPELQKLHEYQKSLRLEVVASLEKKFGLSDAELKRKVEQYIETAFGRLPPPPIPGLDVKAETRKYLIDEILGLGPLEEFMRDPEVDEIMVNGPSRIFLEKSGKLVLSGRSFNNSDHVRAVIDRILIPVGRTVNERTPYVDARLMDGSRAHAIIPPLSLTGPMLTIRRFSRAAVTLEDLIYRFGTLTPQVGEFLKMCVKMRKNIIVSGGASSGKTTLLNVLSAFIAPNERVISIEDSAELRLNQINLGRLEARQQGTEAKNQVSIRDLVRNALRMRPDRIIVGECRSEEALDMLQAMNTGHDGSLTTLHSNAPRDAIARLETMVLMAGVDLPLRAIREQIASSINIIIQTSRFSDGTRKVVEVVEVVGIEDTNIMTQTLYKYEKKSVNDDGRICGDLLPTGTVPSFIASIPDSMEESVRRMFSLSTETM
ncbi:MAG: Flp pilus assembly complex ATPase component TadA [Candidatus Riflebacteria bacterium]|nr:Flp pilus assembly complex ATPase component TadA [Candidatus Riflebacteria bacterium]